MHISCEQRSFVKSVRVFVFVFSAVAVIRSVAALHCVLTRELVFIIIIISYGGLLNVYRRYFDQDLPSAYSFAVGLFTFNGRRCSIWHYHLHIHCCASLWSFFRY